MLRICMCASVRTLGLFFSPSPLAALRLRPLTAQGFAFIEFYHSKSATAAYQALDDQTTNMGKLAVAFSNPAKV